MPKPEPAFDKIFPVVRYFVLLLAALAWAGDPVAPRTWWAGPQVTLLGSPSRDGRWISYADPATGALAIRSLVDGAVRTIAGRPEGSREFAHFSVFSRDGSAIAYAWFNAQGFYELRIARVAEVAAPLVAYRNEVAGFVQPCAWTPDNRAVLTLLFRRDNISQIALIPAAGGPARVLRSLNWVYPKRMDVSPDGRWIVYDNFAAEGKPERTIFLLAADGSTEKRLVDAPGNYLFPMWSADGRRVLFAGETGGPMELWAADLEAGVPRGSAYRVSGPWGASCPWALPTRMKFSMACARVCRILSPGVRRYPRVSLDAIAPRHGRKTGNGWLTFRVAAPRTSARTPARSSYKTCRLVKSGTYPRAWRTSNASCGPRMGAACWSRAVMAKAARDSSWWARKMAPPCHWLPSTTLPFRGWEGVWSGDGRAVYYLHGSGELRSHTVENGAESVILRLPGMRHLAINPQGTMLAVGIGGKAVRITPLGSGELARLISFPGLTELAWGTQLYAGRGAELWQLPIGGGDPVRVPTPADRLPGIAIGADGHTLAFARGSESAEVRSFTLSK